MFGFGRKKRQRPGITADTFVEATGGGWQEAPDTLPADGGSSADYVDEVLKRAREHALATGVAVGENFTYTMTDIPIGITGPHEIIFGLIMKAQDHGLAVNTAMNELVDFTRMD